MSVLIEYLRNGMAVVEGVAIRLKPKLLNLRDALMTLAQQFIF